MSAYTMGWIHRWAKLAGNAPWLANFFTQTPWLAEVGKRFAGIAAERQIPVFASQPFTRDRRRSLDGDSRPRVILWPDTFNNYFHPEVCRSAAKVLDTAGFRVELPAQSLCCGRPLYDFGFLDQAKKLLQDILQKLRNDIRAGTPVVVLEPSCAAVFRDELVNFYPTDPDAQRLSAQTFLLSEFLQS